MIIISKSSPHVCKNFKSFCIMAVDVAVLTGWRGWMRFEIVPSFTPYIYLSASLADEVLRDIRGEYFHICQDPREFRPYISIYMTFLLYLFASPFSTFWKLKVCMRFNGKRKQTEDTFRVLYYIWYFVHITKLKVM